MLSMAKNWVQRAIGAVTGRKADTASLNLRDWNGGRSAADAADCAPMAHSATVYRGVRVIAETIGALGVSLYRDTIDRVVTSGPAVELIRQPMPQTTTREWLEMIAGHLVESGEAHLFDPSGRQPPRQLAVFGRRTMQPVVRNGEILWWECNIGGRMRRVMPEENACLLLFNPYDPTRGLSPVEAAALDVKHSYAAARYNVSALGNGGTPGGLLKVPGTLTEDERREMERTLSARFQGPGNANRTLVGTGGMEWQPIGFKNTDLELLESRKLSREEVLSALGVPPVLAGIFESAHYDVADQAILIFMHNTIAPLVSKIQDLLNLVVLPRVERGVLVRINLHEHPAYLAMLTQQIDAAQKMVNTGTPYNEATRVAGLSVKPQLWGDRSLVPAGVTTVDDVLAGPPDAAAPAADQSARMPNTAIDRRIEALQARKERRQRVTRASHIREGRA